MLTPDRRGVDDIEALLYFIAGYICHNVVMNARRHVIDIKCDVRQVEDCVSCLFHTILFHRTLGKFTFREDKSGHQTIVIGTVGFDDVDCSSVDLS